MHPTERRPERQSVLDQLHEQHRSRSIDLSLWPRSQQWDVLCIACPELRRIELQMMALPRRGKRSWSNYEHFKRQISALVGWESRDPRLATCDAYDAAIRVVVREVAP